MKNWIKRRLPVAVGGVLAVVGGGLLALSYSGCAGNEVKEAKVDRADPVCNCTDDVSVKFGPTVPGDLLFFSSQDDVDCFAWSEFVALNWPTSGGFGDSLDTSPVQWETYMPGDVLYSKDGTAPPPWGSTLVPRAFAAQASLLRLPEKTKILHFSTKFEDISAGSIRFSTGQAAPQDGPNWLGAQNGTNVWYEILVNKDIYDYVVRTHFYDARAQVDSARKGIPVNFPAGMYNSNVTGAIELKAAWMEVTDPANPKWKRYKLSKAEVQDANTGQLRAVTVALVGLHILHKTANQKTWVWATFEQVDNVPDATRKKGDFNFYNDHCDTCRSNVPPTYYLRAGGPKPVPIQITRVYPLDTTAVHYNKVMQTAIADRYPHSVWQYYELVDALWNNGSQPVTNDTLSAPFPMNNPAMAPSTVYHPVANTTMESYIQQLTCTGCHTGARIAPVPGDTMKTFSDFSFLIGTAGASKKH